MQKGVRAWKRTRKGQVPRIQSSGAIVTPQPDRWSCLVISGNVPTAKFMNIDISVTRSKSSTLLTLPPLLFTLLILPFKHGPRGGGGRGPASRGMAVNAAESTALWRHHTTDRPRDSAPAPAPAPTGEPRLVACKVAISRSSREVRICRGAGGTQ